MQKMRSPSILRFVSSLLNRLSKNLEAGEFWIYKSRAWSSVVGRHPCTDEKRQHPVRTFIYPAYDKVKQRPTQFALLAVAVDNKNIQ